MLHVIGFDVGNHRHHGQQVEKGGVAFVRFHNQIITCTQLSIGPGVVQDTTNHKRGVQARLSHERSNETCRRCFTVSPSDSDAKAIAHELSKHFGSGNDRYTLLSGSLNFRVSLVNGR